MDSPPIPLPTPALPIAQLESLKFKANQIIESIQSLQRLLEAGHQGAMPAWPDILSKYNILLSQTHNFSTALVTPIGAAPTVSYGPGGVPQINAGAPAGAGNPYERIALHPSRGMTDTQLDGEVIPLLRNQQTTEVLRMENETVRRLAEHMVTRGSVGVLGLGGPPSSSLPAAHGLVGLGIYGAQGQKKPEYEDVLRECDQIKGEHDQRVERAVRAVTMLREKFDWKQRVEVEVEEPEELDWDPRLGMQNGQTSGGDERIGQGEDVDGDAGMDSPEDETGDGEGDGGSSEEDDEVEGALQLEEGHTPTSPAMPTPGGLFFSPATVAVTTTDSATLTPGSAPGFL